MTAPVEITFPAPVKPLTANDRMHPMERAEAVRIWRQATYAHARAQLGADVPRFGRARIDITIAFPTVRVRDPANWHPTGKAIVDALVAGRGRHRGLGILNDDSAAYLDGPYLHHADRVTRAAVPQITVRITPVEAP